MGVRVGGRLDACMDVWMDGGIFIDSKIVRWLDSGVDKWLNKFTFG